MPRSSCEPRWKAYFHVGRSPILDCRPLTRLARPSVLPSLLLLRPGVEGVMLELEAVRCFGVGSILLRRLLITLGARVLRRAIGLSSMALSSPSASSSAMGAWRLEAGVDERGVDRIGILPLAGVEGDCIGLANGRFDCAMGVVDAGRRGVVETGRLGAWCEGVVEAGRAVGGGDSAGRLNGLRTGIEDPLDMRLRDRGVVSFPLRYGDGVVRLSGLKLWPTTVSRMLTLEFHRGLTAGRSDLGVIDRKDAEVMARGSMLA